MNNIQLNIVANAQFQQVYAEVAKLKEAMMSLQKASVGGPFTPQVTASIRQAQSAFDSAVLSTRAFTVEHVAMSSSVEKFGKQLSSGKLSLSNYYKIWRDSAKGVSAELDALATSQARLNRSVAIADPLRPGYAKLVTDINGVVTAQEKAIFYQKGLNTALQQGAVKLIDFGKNTQWMGRQLTVGLTMPLAMFGAGVSQAFLTVDKELTRMQKVYGTGLIQPTQAALKQVRADVVALGNELARTLGTSMQETASMSADLAATGLEGAKLIGATREAIRLATLGELDHQQAVQATISLQNVYKLSTQGLTEAVNFLNAVENQTSTSLQDLVDAIPRVGPIVQQLGGSFKDTAAMMVAMKEAGVPAAQGANAIKSALASLINPSKNAQKAFGAFNIDLNSLVRSTNGNPVMMLKSLADQMKNLDRVSQAQLIEKLFGKYQFARVQALLDNINKSGSQTATVFKLMGASTTDLANLAAGELKKQTESASGRFKRMVETLKTDMLPLGNMFLNSFTRLGQAVDKIVSAFKTMGNVLGPVGKILSPILGTGLAGLIVIGPIIMLVGLFANLIGNVLRGANAIRMFKQGLDAAGPSENKFMAGLHAMRNFYEDLDKSAIAARNQIELMPEAITSNATAFEVLRKSIYDLTAQFTALAAAQREAMGFGMAAGAGKANPFNIPWTGKKMATGGWVPGNPSHGDIFPALLSGQEFVVPSKQAVKYSSFLNAIMKDNLPGFQDGFAGRQIAHLSGDINIGGTRYSNPAGAVRYSQLSPAHQAQMAQSFNYSQEEIANDPMIKNSFVAAYEKRINQASNNGTLTIKEMIGYLQNSTRNVGLEYGALMKDLGVSVDKIPATIQRIDNSLIRALQQAASKGAEYIADVPRRANQISSDIIGATIEQTLGSEYSFGNVLSPVESRTEVASKSNVAAKSRRRRFASSIETAGGALLRKKAKGGGMLSGAAAEYEAVLAGNLYAEANDPYMQTRSKTKRHSAHAQARQDGRDDAADYAKTSVDQMEKEVKSSGRFGRFMNKYSLSGRVNPQSRIGGAMGAMRGYRGGMGLMGASMLSNMLPSKVGGTDISGATGIMSSTLGVASMASMIPGLNAFLPEIMAATAGLGAISWFFKKADHDRQKFDAGVRKTYADLEKTPDKFISKIEDQVMLSDTQATKYKNLSIYGKVYGDTMLKTINAIGSGSIKGQQLTTTLNALNTSTRMGTTQFNLLKIAAKNAGDTKLTGLISEIEKVKLSGLAATNTLISLVRMDAAGGSSSDFIARYGVKGIADPAAIKSYYGPLIASAQSALSAAQHPSVPGGQGNANAQAELKKQIKAQEVIKKNLQDQLKTMQDQAKVIQQQNDYYNKQTDLTQQIKQAEVTGNYIQAAQLRAVQGQQTAQYKQQMAIDAKQAQVDRQQAVVDSLNEQLQKLQDIASKAAEVAANTSAIKTAQDNLNKLLAAQKDALKAAAGGPKGTVDDPIVVKPYVPTKAEQQRTKDYLGPGAASHLNAFVDENDLKKVGAKRTGVSQFNQGTYQGQVITWQGKKYTIGAQDPITGKWSIVPKMHSWNGIVPGAYGMEVPAILRAGSEGVYQKNYIAGLKQRAYGNAAVNSSATSSTNQNINFYINGSNDPQAVANIVMQKLKTVDAKINKTNMVIR